MEVFKTYLFISGHEDGHPFLIDTIFYENEWWLVSSWLYHDARKEQIPERLVQLTGLQYQEVNLPDHRFLLNNSMPKSVLDGIPQDGYVLANYPALLHTQGPKTVQ